MQMYRFDEAVGRQIDAFGSTGLKISRVGRLDGWIQIGCMHLSPGGQVGRHQVTVAQLFLVVQGTGWVVGDDGQRLPIQAGQAAFWAVGEWHEAGTDPGMTAVVLEAKGIDPSAVMPGIENL